VNYIISLKGFCRVVNQTGEFSLEDTAPLTPDGPFRFCRVIGQTAEFPRSGLSRSSCTDHSCQCRKLVGERHSRGGVDCELALTDHVNQLDAGEHRAGSAE
jgi:hypothetical protein